MVYALLDSPLGPLTAVSDGRALRALWMDGQRYAGQPEGQPVAAEADPVLRELAGWLRAYFAGGRPEAFSWPLAPEGTPFRRQVWALLGEIPYGATTTYAALAARLGSSPRAVGGAVGRNPISILIPCHRVVGSGGALTGYAGGLARKQFLLELERRAV